MKHEVFWDEENHCVWLKVFGEFAPEEATRAMGEVQSLLEGKRERLLVVDHTNSPHPVSRETRAALEESGAEIKPDKMAFFGTTNLSRIMAKVVVAVMGQSEHTKFFKTEDEALVWIRDRAGPA